MAETHLEALLTLVEAQGLDALALVPGPNLLYCTGLHFSLSERPVIALFPIDGTPTVIAPEFEAAKVQDAGMDVFTYTDEEGYTMAFHEACAALELADARIGVETLRMRLLEARILQRYSPGAELVPADDLCAELRITKDALELAAMRRAVAVAEAGFRAWLPGLRVGMTEREAAARLVASLLTNGADALSFEPIVVAGPNSALPHGVPGDRRVQPGDWMVVDWGVMVDGYASDLTRCVVFGEPRGVLRDVHALVLRANAAGCAAAGPGVSAEAVDAATRAVIEAGGHGPRFTHRTGHGLGLEVHEPPYIVAGNSLVLQPGMTFTVEPGVYLEGVGGVRIEDDVVITEEGAEVLATLPRTPFSISDKA